jgi:hypothetical protein
MDMHRGDASVQCHGTAHARQRSEARPVHDSDGVLVQVYGSVAQSQE